jgi:non-ribosomal peptide synthetase component F
VPIGSVIGDRVAYILDADLALVPQGATGELYVGGPAWPSRLSRPSGHERRALRGRSVCRDGGRLYRTGDLVRQRADGWWSIWGGSTIR